MNLTSSIVLAAIISVIFSVALSDPGTRWTTQAPEVNRTHKSDKGVFVIEPRSDLKELNTCVFSLATPRTQIVFPGRCLT